MISKEEIFPLSSVKKNRRSTGLPGKFPTRWHPLAMPRKRGRAAGHGFEVAVASRSHLEKRQRFPIAWKICG